MNTLIFYPRPFPSESIGSILIRASTPHGLTPVQLLRGLKRPCKSFKSIIQATLRGNMEDIGKIALIDNWKPPLLQKTLVSSKNFDRWLSYTKAAICPRCAENGWLSHIHDYSFMTTCATHACKLIRHCPTCELPLRWNRSKLSRGACKHDLTELAPSSVLEVEEAIILEKWIHLGEADLIESYLFVRHVLAERYEIFDVDPQLIQALLVGNPNDFVPLIREILSKLKSIPHRAALRPILLNCGLLAKERLELIDVAYSRPSIPNHPDQLQSFYLNRFELSDLLGLNLVCTEQLIQQCLPSYQLRNKDKKKIPLSSLNHFYQALVPDLPNPNTGATLRQVSASKKIAIGILTRGIMDGQIKPTYFDENANIGDLKIDDSHELVTGLPQGYLNLGQTVARLNTHSIAVIEGYKRSLLKGIKPRNKNQYAFHPDDIDRFDQEYVIGTSIRSAEGTQIRRISGKLISAGIQPVSGKCIDGGSVYIFRRKDLIGLDIEAINRNPNYTKHRNLGPENHHGLNRSEWMKSTAAAEELGIATQQLHLFVSKKLLIEKTPGYSNSARLRYFRIDSIELTKAYINSLVPLRKVCEEIGTSVRAALQRMAHVIGSRPLQLNKIEYIEKAHSDALKHHFLCFWDLSTSAKFFGINQKEIHQWLLQKKIHPLEPSDDDYIPELTLMKAKEVMATNSENLFQQ